jgi:hypothetical protein
MPTVFLAPDPIQGTKFIPGGNTPAAGGQLFCYVNKSTTKQNMYTTQAGNVAWSNPIVMDSGGNLGGTNEVWIPSGLPATFVFAPANDTDPPASPYWTMNDVSGINDTSVSASEWVSGGTPTFVSATSFTVAGDQTATYTIGRRLQTVNTGGTIYSTISKATFGGAVTTITVVNDSGVLDSGLSAVSYALLNALHPSMPPYLSGMRIAADVTDPSKNFTVAMSGLASSTQAIMTITGSGTFPSTGGSVLRDYIAAYTLSMAVGSSSAVLNLGPGVATDTSNAISILSTTTIAKNTNPWVVGSGNGGLLDSGTISSSAWYHAFTMQNSSGIVDWGFSSSAVQPPIPSGYLYFRRVGSAFTNTSSVWNSYTQNGPQFNLHLPVLDVNVTNPGTSASLRTMSIPAGIPVYAITNLQIIRGATNPAVLLSDPAIPDILPSFSSAPLGQIWFPNPLGASGDGAMVGSQYIRSSSNAQIRTRVSASDGSTILRIATLGWVDERGNNA